MVRSLMAFLLTPFPAAFFQAMIVATWPKEGMGVFAHPASMFAAICLLFYIVGFLIGLPLFLFVRKRYRLSWRDYAVGGAAVLSLPIIIGLVVLGVRGQLSAYVAWYNLVFFAVGGALAGIMFRCIKGPAPYRQA